ncbi:hypothetical protein GCM10020220_031270 [Nonomuraea rubra]
MRSIRPGSKVAAQASGVGYAVAPYVANPVRHSSCAIAGMPCRLAAITCSCMERRRAAPSAGLRGAVP